jgi:hypothetical protein
MNKNLVECHSETEYPERPLAIHWEGQRLEIAEILNEWRSPRGKHFRLRAINQAIFEIAYDTLSDEWTILAP